MGIQKRLSRTTSGSTTQLSIKETLSHTSQRFDYYSRTSLLCGSDGLPHLVSDPGFSLLYGHYSDVLLPTLCFIYLAGWLGYSGRLYLQSSNSTLEIVLDVPLALLSLLTSLNWPISAYKSLSL